MRTRHSSVSALAMIAGIALALGVIRGQTPAPAAPKGTGILSGQTVDAVTGAPVANTLIGLSQRASSGPNTTPTMPNTQLVTVMTDSIGRFVVRDVPKGSFLILATAPGYIVSNYGQGRATGPTRTVDLEDGEVRVNLKIPLWRHAVIAGTVTDETGEPVVGITVRVLRRAPNGAGGQLRYMPGTATTTDDRGAYRLTALTPGTFLVTVPQTQVTVPSAVVDNFLQSMSGRAGGSAGGQLLDLMSSSSAVPSAGGGVRIDNLLLQSASDTRLLAVPPPARDGLLVYTGAIYSAGGGTDQTELKVGPGEERSGINLRLVPNRSVRVSGTVTADGVPAGNVGVRLVKAGGRSVQNENGFEAAATVTASDGTFTLLGVTAGEYTLKVLKTARLMLPPSLAANPAIVAAYTPGGTPAPAATTPSLGAQIPLRIGTSDIRDLAVALRPGATITGRVVFTGAQPTQQQTTAMGMLVGSEDGGLPGAGIQIARVGADGTFKLTAPAPGRYLLSPLMPPPGRRMSGVLVGGKPLTGPLDLRSDDVTDYTLTYTDEVAEISGVVRTAAGAPVQLAEIVVFPIDRTAWMQEPLNPRQPRVEQTAGGGIFRMPGLLPGEYFVAAIDEADVPDIADVTFFEAVARIATRVTLRATDKSTQDLIVRRIR